MFGRCGWGLLRGGGIEHPPLNCAFGDFCRITKVTPAERPLPAGDLRSKQGGKGRTLALRGGAVFQVILEKGPSSTADAVPLPPRGKACEGIDALRVAAEQIGAARAEPLPYGVGAQQRADDVRPYGVVWEFQSGLWGPPPSAVQKSTSPRWPAEGGGPHKATGERGAKRRAVTQDRPYKEAGNAAEVEP